MLQEDIEKALQYKKAINNLNNLVDKDVTTGSKTFYINREDYDARKGVGIKVSGQSYMRNDKLMPTIVDEEIYREFSNAINTIIIKMQLKLKELL